MEYSTASQLSPKKDFHNSIKLQEEYLIIPGLPNDVATLCIAFVPRVYFPVIKNVSKRWRTLVQSKEFHLTRTKAGTLEDRLYVLTTGHDFKRTYWEVYNSTCNKWEKLPVMPGPAKSNFGFVVLDQKLLVIGGLVQFEGMDLVSAELHNYDTVLNRWTKSSSMKTARYDFACVVLAGFVYVAGGLGADGEGLTSVEMYNPEKDEWADITSLKSSRWGCFACAFQGKLHVLGGRSGFTIGNPRYMDVYDPVTKLWEEEKCGCVMVLTHAALSEQLYCIEWKDERKLVLYNAFDKAWKRIAMPLARSTRSSFRLTNVNGKLFFLSAADSPSYKTLVYDPHASKGKEWQTSAIIKPAGKCLGCLSIAA
ncbi:hypothetical protein O6H91_02G050100 [Diphasiastrum complanatum]|uniref:Uncharacterized protein n=1 Tax=Diphasiastrum complanatum TaxID=34168 RepID=A0ACC2EFF4_DIPCM|nr:hypothetical protein O6H91_02G050100 [Diphasiastrum complanatum]